MLTKIFDTGVSCSETINSRQRSNLPYVDRAHPGLVTVYPNRTGRDGTACGSSLGVHLKRTGPRGLTQFPPDKDGMNAQRAAPLMKAAYFYNRSHPCRMVLGKSKWPSATLHRSPDVERNHIETEITDCHDNGFSNKICTAIVDAIEHQRSRVKIWWAE